MYLKSVSINLEDVPEKWKYYLTRVTWKVKVLPYNMYLKSESIKLEDVPEKYKY
jgi:hypothetical protein